MAPFATPLDDADDLLQAPRKRFPLDAEHRDGPIRGVAGSPLPKPASNPVAFRSFEVSARRTAHRPCAWGIIDGLRSYRGKTINSAGAQIQIRNSESKTAISDKNFLAVREDAAAAAARGIPVRGPLPNPAGPIRAFHCSLP
jgi:hypothetical protein